MAPSAGYTNDRAALPSSAECGAAVGPERRRRAVVGVQAAVLGFHRRRKDEPRERPDHRDGLAAGVHLPLPRGVGVDEAAEGAGGRVEGGAGPELPASRLALRRSAHAAAGADVHVVEPQRRRREPPGCRQRAHEVEQDRRGRRVAGQARATLTVGVTHPHAHDVTGSDADRPGVAEAVARGGTLERYLSSALK